MKHFLSFAFAAACAVLLSSISTSAGAAAPLLEYRSKDDVKLPPMSSRKVLGTWNMAAVAINTKCTRSFEEVSNKVYDVLRCGGEHDGDDGRLVKRASPAKFLSTTNPGDYYVILKNGDLSVRDKKGEVEVLVRSSAPNGAAANSAAASSDEDKKTVGLDCYTVGYRYGVNGTWSMNGKSTNPAWDFAAPDRCKAQPELRRGIAAGTKAAW